MRPEVVYLVFAACLKFILAAVMAGFIIIISQILVGAVLSYCIPMYILHGIKYDAPK